MLREEPFRLFFPLAVLASIGGVALWPLLHHRVITFYPGEAHSRIMIGAMAGFVIGFLTTAIPRMASSPPLHTGELGVILALWTLALVMYFDGQIAPGDALMAAAFWSVFAILGVRAVGFRRDTIPPGGPVALLGLVAAALALSALAWGEGGWMKARTASLAALTLYQAPVLLPLLGVGPYLLPRLFGRESAHDFEESRSPPAGWWLRMSVTAGGGVMILVSLLIEAAGWPGPGMLLRAGTVAVVFLVETPVFRRARTLTTPGTGVRIGILSIVLGLVWASFDPSRRIGISHLVFVSGFGLVMLCVAVRVVLGHAGRPDLARKRIRWLRILIVLIVLAAATRVSADFVSSIRASHLDYAAVTWVLVALLWLWRLRPHFFAVEEAD